MNALQRFDFGPLPIRVHLDNDEPWFVLTDVCEALELTSPHKVADRLEDDEKGRNRIPTPGGPQEMVTVSEAGLYRVIFRSNKDTAKRFQRWVFHEVLPELRRTGSYQIEGTAAAISEVDQPLLEREVRLPDGRVIIERYARPHEPAPDITSIEYEEEFDDLTPQVSVDVLRKRFHRAANQELRNIPEYRRLSDREQRATFCRRLNSQLKAFIGRERAEWTALDYHNAVHWLVMQYGLDVRWILEPLDNVVELGGER